MYKRQQEIFYLKECLRLFGYTAAALSELEKRFGSAVVQGIPAVAEAVQAEAPELAGLLRKYAPRTAKRCV